MIGIKDIATFFPVSTLSAADLPGGTALSADERAYFSTVGIEQVRVAEQDNGYALGKNAAMQLLEKNNIEGDDIQLIINIQSRLPEYFMSSSSAKLQSELHATNALVLAISDLGCTDMSMALKLAKDFLTANDAAEHVLICYGNKPYSPSRYRFPVTIYGDGGIAVLVGRTERNRIIDVDIRTEGKYWDLFKVEYLGKTFEQYQEVCTNHRRYSFELAIESKMRFAGLNNDILEKNELERADISHYILQNISLRAYEFYETAFGVKLSPVCKHNLQQYGHLGPADVMLNYKAGIESGLFRAGEKVLIMNNSPVASWSTILIEV